MRGVLIDDNQSILGRSDDKRIVELRARRSERIGGVTRVIVSDASARIGARLRKRVERGLSPLGEAEGAPFETFGSGTTPRRRRRHAPERGFGQRCRGAMAGSAKRRLERADDERAHPVRIAESELGLGGMNVDVNLIGRKRQE